MLFNETLKNGSVLKINKHRTQKYSQNRSKSAVLSVAKYCITWKDSDIFRDVIGTLGDRWAENGGRCPQLPMPWLISWIATIAESAARSVVRTRASGDLALTTIDGVIREMREIGRERAWTCSRSGAAAGFFPATAPRWGGLRRCGPCQGRHRLGRAARRIAGRARRRRPAPGLLPHRWPWLPG